MNTGLPDYPKNVRQVIVDPAGRILLGALDGSRTFDELVAFMQAELAKTGLDLPLDQLRELTAQQLWLFARQGLLLAAC